MIKTPQIAHTTRHKNDIFAALNSTKSTIDMQIHDLSFQPLLSAHQIQLRVSAIASNLSIAYENKCPLFISVLNGAFVFASDLLREFKGPCEIAFVKLESYTGTTSSGKIQTVLGLTQPIEGRDVIIVEDIVDSGRTLHLFINSLKLQKPNSICTVALLFKPEAIQFPVYLDHVGFELPNDFVVGYGLDYNGLGRNLPDLYVLPHP